MKKYDYTTMHGMTDEDEKTINAYLEDEFELVVDDYNRVWAGEIYIADAIEDENF